MDGCSLFALISCFSWSNLYLETDLSYRDVSEYVTTQRYFESVTAIEGVVDRQEFSSSARDRISGNPYGRVAIGHQMLFTGERGLFEFSAELFHESSLATGKDRGMNGIAIRAKWFPMGSRR